MPPNLAFLPWASTSGALPFWPLPLYPIESWAPLALELLSTFSLYFSSPPLKRTPPSSLPKNGSSPSEDAAAFFGLAGAFFFTGATFLTVPALRVPAFFFGGALGLDPKENGEDFFAGAAAFFFAGAGLDPKENGEDFFSTGLGLGLDPKENGEDFFAGALVLGFDPPPPKRPALTVTGLLPAVVDDATLVVFIAQTLIPRPSALGVVLLGLVWPSIPPSPSSTSQ